MTPAGIHMVMAYLATVERGTLYFNAFLFDVSFGFRTIFLFWAFAPVVGLLCVFTHWLFIRRPEPKA
jgi:hypothetical protein